MIVKHKNTIILFLLLITAIYSSQLNTSLYSNFYLHKDLIDTENPFFTYYENLHLSGESIGGSDISIYSGTRLTNRKFKLLENNVLLDKKQLEFSSLYLKWAKVFKKINIHVGRFSSYDFYKPLHLDGVKFDIDLIKKLDLSVIAGKNIPSKFSDRYFDFATDSSVFEAAFKTNVILPYKTLLSLSVNQGYDSKGINKNNIELISDKIIGSNFNSGASIAYSIIKKDIEYYNLYSTYTSGNLIDAFLSFSRENEKPDTNLSFERQFLKGHNLIDFSCDISLNEYFTIRSLYNHRFFFDGKSNNDIELEIDYKILNIAVSYGFGSEARLYRYSGALDLLDKQKYSITIAGGYEAYTQKEDIDAISAASVETSGDISISAGYNPNKIFSTNLIVLSEMNSSYEIDYKFFLNTNLKYSKFFK